MFVNFNCNHASREMFPRGSVNKVIEVNEHSPRVANHSLHYME